MPRHESEQLDLKVLYEATIGKPAIKTAASVDRVLLADNAGRFTKIGFDLFRDNEFDCIWKVETADDGNDYLIRTQLPADSIVTAEHQSHWDAISDSKRENLTLAYKGTAIKRFAVVEGKTAGQCAKVLLKKIAEAQFTQTVLSGLSEQRKEQLKLKHPELFAK